MRGPFHGSSTAVLALAAAVAAACGSAEGVAGDATPMTHDAATDREGATDAEGELAVGDAIGALELVGYVDPSQGLGPDHRVHFSTQELHNPTGQGVFAAGSAFGAGRPQPRALVLVVAAAWCGASLRELDQVLPSRYAQFAPRGAELVVVLAEGFVADQRAELDELDQLLAEVTLGSPVAVDPAYRAAERFGAASFPDNALIDTRDMTIVALTSGASTEAFWDALDAMLAAGEDGGGG